MTTLGCNDGVVLGSSDGRNNCLEGNNDGVELGMSDGDELGK